MYVAVASHHHGEVCVSLIHAVNDVCCVFDSVAY